MKLPNLKFNFGVRDILTASPARYWNLFLLVFSVLLLIVLIFDGWIFLKFSSPVANEATLGAFNQAGVIKRSSLDAALGVISGKKKNFSRLQSGAPLEEFQ